MAQLGTIDLGIVKNENSVKDSNLFFYPIPTKDSHEAFLLDIMGVGRTITVSGEIIGTKEQIKSKVGLIENVANGKQGGLNYNGEIITGKNTFIQSFSWDYREGDPSRVVYTLTLLEGEDVGA